MSSTATTMTPLPKLDWVTGTIFDILIQPGEKFYVFSIREANGTTKNLRIADAHTGAPVTGVTSDNLVYDLLKESYFRKLTIQVGYRDFGFDQQAGIEKIVIDRVKLSH